MIIDRWDPAFNLAVDFLLLFVNLQNWYKVSSPEDKHLTTYGPGSL